LGGQLHWQRGQFDQDLLLISDNENFPYFDLSTAYIANYNFGKTLRIGAGVNFYHWYAITDSLTNGNWDRVNSVDIDTTNPAAPDTTTFGFSGTKVMANAAFDPKSLFGNPEIFGAEDLKIYFEVAVLGLDNTAPYKKVYGTLQQRMPMMIGFNIPCFKLLDRLAIEVEHYGSKAKDDLAGFNHTAGSHPNPLPLKDPVTKQPIVASKDDTKWSIYGSRVMGGHTKVSFQIANDHFRPGVYTGDGDNNAAGSQSLMTSSKDWYTMLKLAYFF
jgi:hypothetical protein